MNSKLHTIIKSCIDDPHDKTITEAEKAIRKAVASEILELLPKKPRAIGDLDSDYTAGMHSGISQAIDELRQKIKEYGGLK